MMFKIFFGGRTMKMQKEKKDPGTNEFNVKIRGYDQSEVDTYIDKLRSEFAEVCAHLQDKVKALEAAHADQDDIVQVMLCARSDARRMEEQAKAEAESILENARTQADKFAEKVEAKANIVFNEAQMQAEKMFTDAKTRADTVLKTAQFNAGKIVKNAKREAERILTPDAAQSEARKILSDAEEEARRMIGEAKTKAGGIEAVTEVEAARIIRQANQYNSEVREKMQQVYNISSMFLDEMGEADTDADEEELQAEELVPMSKIAAHY